MAKAMWRGTVIAESDKCEIVEGNHYFPPNSIKKEFFKKSQTHSLCPWKGKASYYTIVVEGKENKEGAWYYPNPSFLAKKIKGHVAFWNGVKVIG